MELQCNVLVDGRRKPLCTDVVIAAHANVRTTIISLYTFENFLRFQLQDKHNASYFSNMSWKGMPQSKCKSNKKNCDNHLSCSGFICLPQWNRGLLQFHSLTFPLRYNGLSYALPQFLGLLHESFADGSQVNRKDELTVVRLCSSEYNSPLYSMGLPVSNVAVCSLLKPTARHYLSM